MQKEKKKEGKVETSWTRGVEKGSIASLLHVGAILAQFFSLSGGKIE